MFRIFKRLNYKPRNYNLKLLFYVLVINIVGSMVVNSATMNVDADGGLTIYQKQMIGILIGLILMGVISLIDYHFIVFFIFCQP